MISWLDWLFFFFAILALNACATQPVYPSPETNIVARDLAVDITEKSKPILLEELAMKQAEWKAKEPEHYRYFYANSSYFICSVSCGPLEVEVIDSEVVRVTYRGKRRSGLRSGDVLPKSDWSKYGLHTLLSNEVEFIQDAQPLSGDGWTKEDRLLSFIAYDAKWGFPKILLSEHPYHYHGESETVIYDFEVFE